MSSKESGKEMVSLQDETTTSIVVREDGAKEMKLPSGKGLVIFKGKGKHAMEAMKICDGKFDRYLPALMSLLVEIDGHPIVLEDLEEIDMQDYMFVLGEFSDQNFTLPQGT